MISFQPKAQDFRIVSILLFVSFAASNCNDHEKYRGSKDDPEQSSGDQAAREDIDGMVWIPGGRFSQGALAIDTHALDHEKPAHEVEVDGFYMDVHEVTNAQFSKFVEETGYVTVAERKVDWEELKEQLPEGIPKPHDSVLKPGSMTFMKCHSTPLGLQDYSQWWNWTAGANWKHPKGPDSTILGLENHPVVQVAYEDALAYCKWAGRRLPTEAEWEYAARGNQNDNVFFWGNEASDLKNFANTWEGEFPVRNTLEDGFERSAPVRSYAPNAFGLYDMAGNVWEWTSDWYSTDYYQNLKEKGPAKNPKGPKTAFNPSTPNAKEKIIKGGSFLCHASYCASYRISSRMATTPDSSLEHLGFRTVTTVNMRKDKKQKN